MTANLVPNAKRVVKAMITNQLAHYAPALYVRMTGETGRGLGAESSNQAADYFRTCFDDYFAKLGIAPADIPHFLHGKRLLEYGPGDIPGVALLMVAHGAASAVCVDRFPLLQLSKKNRAVLQDLLNALPDAARQRAEACFMREGDLSSGFKPERIRYQIDPNGLSRLQNEVDLVLSRAVLEHVNDLEATLADMHAAMKPGALAIHQVDLKSHGLHQHNPLDFLTWPEALWLAMYSHKGVPNRLRIDRYRDILHKQRFHIRLLEPTTLATLADVQAIRSQLAQPFQTLSDADLQVLGFWLLCSK